MAHKTLIDGTAYDIKSSKTLVSGTEYAIKSGKTLVDGTGYNITFKKWVETFDSGLVTKSVSQIVASGSGSMTVNVLFATGYSFDESTGLFTLTGTTYRQTLTATSGSTTRTKPTRTDCYFVANIGSNQPVADGHNEIWRYPTSNTSDARFELINTTSTNTTYISLSAYDETAVGYTKIYSVLE